MSFPCPRGRSVDDHKGPGRELVHVVFKTVGLEACIHAANLPTVLLDYAFLGAEEAA